MTSLQKKYEIGKEVQIVNLKSGKVEKAEVTAHTIANFKKFAGIIVRFESGNFQECDREFL